MSKKHTISTIFPNEQYVTRQKGDGENPDYFLTFDDAESAVDLEDSKEALVATYKLVKVEKLRLFRTTLVMKVK